MLTYSYKARDLTTGKVVKAEIQADNEQAASKLIRQQGLTPVDISVKGGFAILGKRRRHVKTKDRILFTRQLATLINAGLPLVQSLRSVNEQTENKQLKIIINDIIARVESGAAFSASLANHSETFSQVYISLVSAGEASGTLDEALERLATQQEKDAEVISKVRGAMVYPLIVLVVMIGVVGFMIVKVLPQVEILYNGLPGNQELPILTRVLLGISHAIIKYWWVVIITVVLLGVFMSRWARTLGGKRFIDKFKMRGWPIGPLFMKMYMARFSRTGSSLVSTGVPLIQTLEITGKAVNNVYIEESLTKAIDKVKGGKALSEALQGDPNFLRLVPDMLKIGEQSGSIEQMLARAADYYEKEVDTQIKTISTIIEPVMMVVLGIVAFIIVAAVLLPVYGLAGKSGFGG